jgi:hypothetical protein
MNTKHALNIAYGLGLLAATTISLIAEPSVPVDKKEVKNAIQILKSDGQRANDKYGVQFIYPYSEGYGNLSQIIYQETEKDNGMFSVSFAEQEGDYIKIFTVIDYGTIKQNGRGDGKPDGIADVYMALKIKESEVLKMFFSGETDMDKYVIDEGTTTPKIQKIYDDAVYHVLKNKRGN